MTQISLSKSHNKSQEEVEKLVLAHEAVTSRLEGAQPKKLIVVPGRIVNVVL